jgi:hypothetical protein
MNLDSLANNLLLRTIICKNEAFNKVFLNLSKIDNGIELLSIFMFKYDFITSYKFLDIKELKSLSFNISEIELTETLTKIQFEDKDLLESTYCGDSIYTIYLGSKIINGNSFNFFYLIGSEFIFLIKKEITNEFISMVMTPMYHTILENDFKFLKNELESSIDEIRFLKIE